MAFWRSPGKSSPHSLEKTIMPINETIIEEPVTDLTSQIGNLFSGTYRQLQMEAGLVESGEPADVELGESFDMWKLDPNAIHEAVVSRTFPAFKTDFQHHQILIGGKPLAYAISEKPADGQRRVVSVTLSRLAERVDQAIDVLDPTGDDTAARFLAFPSFRIYAFWLEGRHQVYVISTPDQFAKLRRVESWTETEFLQRLYDEIGPLLTKTLNGEQSPI
jgi:hypothetical protein